jgi:hypothetical protein
MSPPLDDASDPISRLEVEAVLHGAYRWVERRLYELTGAWAGANDVAPEVRVHLFEMSARHAWHAELWEERLPVLAGVDPDALTQPLGSALGRLVDALGTVGTDEAGGGRQLARLAALYRVVLPRLVVTYRAHLGRLAGVPPGPAARALVLVLRDEEEQQWEGESILQRLLATAGDVERVASVQRLLELLVVGSGGGKGLLPWWETEKAGFGLSSARPT